MKSLWNENEAKQYKSDLDMRVYTSRLLGKNSSLVLHGGGNTSVKATVSNLFGKKEEILYVKGSGWDLATIQPAGFSPVKMDMLLKMAKLNELSDTNMVKYQRMAMIDPLAPNPSVEAILHAIIPFKYVDHTHADAIITITNTKNGKNKIREIYGDKVLIIPYIMPGFVLAKLVYEMTKDINWDKLEGMVLLNHGLFTFDNNPKKSYEKTIELVTKAEKYLKKNQAVLSFKKQNIKVDTLQLAKIRYEISNLKGCPTIATYNDSTEAVYFSSQNKKLFSQGPLTPDYVIRTKRLPSVIKSNYKKSFKKYIKSYKKYFNKYKTTQTMLNPAPNFTILKDKGSISFGSSIKEANIIKDINNHTFEAILKAEKLGGYKALSAKDIFDVEYWELEQAKLKKNANKANLSGKIAIVTSSMLQEGLTIAKKLNDNGCIVIVVNIDKKIKNILNGPNLIGVQSDLTSKKDINNMIDMVIKKFGGIDIIVHNTQNNFINLTLLKKVLPFLKFAVDPNIVLYGDTVAFLDKQMIKKLDKCNIRLNTLELSTITSKDNLELSKISSLIYAMVE